MSHHVAVARQPLGAPPGWGVWERRGEDWSEIGSTNRSLSRSIDDGVEHAQQWWQPSAREQGVVTGPDLSISARSFDVLSSSPVQLPDRPELLDPIYALEVLLPLGDAGTPAKWAVILRASGLNGRLSAAGELNGLRIGEEVRERFGAAELARFEAAVSFARGFRSELWVRPQWSARQLAPIEFPLPVGRTEAQQADFNAKVAALKAKRAKNKRNEHAQARAFENQQSLVEGRAAAAAWARERAKG